MARPKLTYNNSQKVMEYLQGKSYDRLSNKIKAVLYDVTDREKFSGSTKGINSLYVFEALKRVSVLTNEEVGKCINTFKAHILFNQAIGKMDIDLFNILKSNMFDPEGNVNVEYLKLYGGSYFEKLVLIGTKSYERYGKAVREASKLMEDKIKTKELDESTKKLLDDLINNGTDKKLIMDYLNRIK